jgi:dephospho-CoA kinase
LLFETGRDKDFDAVVVAACEPELQLRRLIARDGLTEPEARARIAAQLPIAEKVRRADVVIRTDGTKAETAAQVDRLVASW